MKFIAEMTEEDIRDGYVVADWRCIDCATNTAPCVDVPKLIANRGGEFILDENSEVYIVRDHVWQRIGSPEGCLCIGCLEIRLGRRLKRKDFPPHAFNHPTLPGTPRLLARRGSRRMRE